MTTFVLLPGAGGSPSVWDRVVPILTDAGQEAIAVDLPGPDPAAGLAKYAQLTAEAATGHEDIALVAQSMGGFTAPMAAERFAVEQLVLINAMIPLPGETPGTWWDATGAVEARDRAAAAGGYGPVDVSTYFLHDVDVTGLQDDQREEAKVAFASKCEFNAWPDVPIRVLAGRDDRFFPVDFQRRVAAERLGITADTLPGGHLISLAQPQLVADYLLKR